MLDFKRQVAMFDPSKHEDVHVVVIGCGNIGSHTALALARMGIQSFTLVDFDTVELHNLSSQAYSFDDNTMMKAKALAGHIWEINADAKIDIVCDAFQKAGVKVNGDTIIVSAVDSMATRLEICTLLEKEGLNNLVLDGRMGGGQIEVHTQKASEWRATLHEVADSDPCGARYISYTSYMIAGLIANNLKRYLQGERYASRILMHTATLEIIKTMV